MRHLAIALAVGLAGCAGQTSAAPAPAPATTTTSSRSTTSDTTARAAATRGGVSVPNDNPFPSTYQPFPSRPTLIRNVTILTAAGPTIRNGSVLLRDGRIAAVGASVSAPSDAVVIDEVLLVHGHRLCAAGQGLLGPRHSQIHRHRAILRCEPSGGPIRSRVWKV